MATGSGEGGSGGGGGGAGSSGTIGSGGEATASSWSIDAHSGQTVSPGLASNDWAQRGQSSLAIGHILPIRKSYANIDVRIPAGKTLNKAGDTTILASGMEREMTWILAIVLALVAPSCSTTGDSARPLNPTVLKMMKGYPTDGSYQYWWPRGSKWAGTTQDLIYQGKTIAKGDSRNRSYCCGLTFEVYFKAYEEACRKTGKPFRIGRLSPSDVTELRLRWYGASRNGDKKKLILEALTSMGLGQKVVRPEDARPGDFVQLWRKNGSGHSVIFLKWERSGRKITGITYWSSQPGTNGIGERTERFSGSRGVDPDQIFIARATKP